MVFHRALDLPLDFDTLEFGEGEGRAENGGRSETVTRCDRTYHIIPNSSPKGQSFIPIIWVKKLSPERITCPKLHC